MLCWRGLDAIIRDLFTVEHRTRTGNVGGYSVSFSRHFTKPMTYPVQEDTWTVLVRKSSREV